jgi:chromate transporter
LAGLLFVVPGALVICALALGYAYFGQVPLVQAGFIGIKATVTVLVAQALWRLSGKTLTDRLPWMLALGAFAALFFGGLPFPLVVLAAGIIGARRPAPGTPSRPRPTGRPITGPATARTIAICSALWAMPLLALWALDQDFLLRLGLFFSKLALVSFGGAYAGLAYMTQSIVADYGWLSPDQMIDALGLAETTPGPLILVTQFVAMMAGFAQQGAGMALMAGALALWVTFVPCFLWIFTAAPYLEAIADHPRLSRALGAITAAIVGVIGSLALWFALHVLWPDLPTGAALDQPQLLLAALDLRALGLMGLAAYLLIHRGWNLGQAIVFMGFAGAALGAIISG